MFKSKDFFVTLPSGISLVSLTQIHFGNVEYLTHNCIKIRALLLDKIWPILTFFHQALFSIVILTIVLIQSKIKSNISCLLQSVMWLYGHCFNYSSIMLFSIIITTHFRCDADCRVYVGIITGIQVDIYPISMRSCWEWSMISIETKRHKNGTHCHLKVAILNEQMRQYACTIIADLSKEIIHSFLHS